MKEQIAQRLAALRRKMSQAGVAAAIIPQADPHMSEYTASHWKGRQYFSGFNGSAGTLVVTMTEALLWTDSRYFLQAGQQLDGTEIRLMKEGLATTPDIPAYLASNLSAGQTVGIDGMIFSVLQVRDLRSRLQKAGLSLDIAFDVLDELWEDRPALPKTRLTPSWPQWRQTPYLSVPWTRSHGC